MSKTPALTLLRNACIYAPQPLGLRSVLIGGGKILAISAEDIQLPAALQAESIDLQGQRLLPGFIDAHTHLTGGGGEAGFATQVPPVPLTHFTRCGVTTVVGLLGTDDTTRSTASLLARVYGLREEGLSAYCWTGGYHYPLTTLTGSVRSDIVYLEPVIGVGEFAISDHRSSQPTLQEVMRVASEAYVAGLMTGKAGIVHFHLGDGDRKLALIRQALHETELPARVFNPTHVNRNKPLFDEALEMLGSGIHIDITAFPEHSAAPGWTAVDAVLLAFERGCAVQRITLSSDGGGCLPDFDTNGELLSMDFGRSDTLLQTLKSLLKAGLPLENVLPFVTSNVAHLLRLRHKGSLHTGADADLIVLDEQHDVVAVMARGQWHKRDQALVKKGTFE